MRNGCHNFRWATVAARQLNSLCSDHKRPIPMKIAQMTPSRHPAACAPACEASKITNTGAHLQNVQPGIGRDHAKQRRERNHNLNEGATIFHTLHIGAAICNGFYG